MPTERREGAIRVGATGQRATGGARRFQRKAAVFGGWHEPDESRGSCPDLGAARGETPRADSANPHVAFDVAGAGDVAWSRGISAKAGAPVLDPTDVAGAGDVAWSRGISAKAGAPVLDPTDERGRDTGSPRRNPRPSSTLLCASLGRAQPEAGGLPFSGDP